MIRLMSIPSKDVTIVVKVNQKIPKVGRQVEGFLQTYEGYRGLR